MINTHANPREYLGKIITVRIDRPMGSHHPNEKFLYPINYGYLEGVPAPDGDNLDAYVLGVFEPVDHFTGQCVAIIHRINDLEDKLIVVPEGKNYSDEQIAALVEFQEQFFISEIERG